MKRHFSTHSVLKAAAGRTIDASIVGLNARLPRRRYFQARKSFALPNQPSRIEWLIEVDDMSSVRPKAFVDIDHCPENGIIDHIEVEGPDRNLCSPAVTGQLVR